MARFIVTHDIDDGNIILLNEETISRIEQRSFGCVVYMSEVADDFDKTKHQISVQVQEDIEYFKETVNTNQNGEQE
jgi:hypothetical protein